MKFIPGPPAGSPSGSIGSMTASHNRYGYYFRNRVIPTNPSSQRQQQVRNTFAALAGLWSSALNASQRAAWKVYAAAITKYDKVGQPYTIPGSQMYIGNNAAIIQAGGARVDDGPTILTLPETDPTFSAAVSEATQLITVTFDDTLGWAGEDGGWMSIKMSAPGGVGTTYNKGPFRLAGALEGDQAVPISSPQTLACPFVIAETQVVTIEARIIRADGRVSEPFRDSISVAA